jgi:hypothetical protein
LVSLSIYDSCEQEVLNVSIVRIFLIDLLNFSFWSDLDVSDKSTPHPDRYAVNYDGQSYTGYWSLCAAINRGWYKTMEAFEHYLNRKLSSC